MRAIWKGAISFGLVTIPVGLYSATEDKTPKFKMLRASDGSPIKYKRVAEADGNEVAWEDIVRGYEVEKGKYVVFTDEELAAAAATSGAKLVDVVQFVDSTEIDPIYYKSSYYLVPEKTGLKAYKIFLAALEDKGRVGIATVAIREKQQLATLRPHDGVLVMETMWWPDEIRQPAFEELEAEVEVRPEELQIIEDLVEKKMEGEEIVAPAAPEPTKVVDLLEALKASVEATKQAREAS